jgi:hypothetical protein
MTWQLAAAAVDGIVNAVDGQTCWFDELPKAVQTSLPPSSPIECHISDYRLSMFMRAVPLVRINLLIHVSAPQMPRTGLFK